MVLGVAVLCWMRCKTDALTACHHERFHGSFHQRNCANLSVLANVGNCILSIYISRLLHIAMIIFLLYSTLGVLLRLL